MNKHQLNEHQLTLWKHMIRLIDLYIGDQISLSELLTGLEGALDAGEFKDHVLVKQWYSFWGSLETYNAVRLDDGKIIKKEEIINKISSMQKFLIGELKSQQD